MCVDGAASHLALGRLIIGRIGTFRTAHFLQILKSHNSRAKCSSLGLWQNYRNVLIKEDFVLWLDQIREFCHFGIGQRPFLSVAKPNILDFTAIFGQHAKTTTKRQTRECLRHQTALHVVCQFPILERHDGRARGGRQQK